MTLRIRAFARYRDLLGFEAAEWALPEPPTLAALLADSRLERLPKEALLAVNQRFAEPRAQLTDGDEVALMPPVSGG